MRAVWCVLVVCCLLSPLGTAGITIAHADAETELAAPRSAVELSSSHKRDLDLVAMVPAAVVPRTIVHEHDDVVPVARSVLRPRLVDRTIRSRAPPV